MNVQLIENVPLAGLSRISIIQRGGGGKKKKKKKKAHKKTSIWTK